MRRKGKGRQGNGRKSKRKYINCDFVTKFSEKVKYINEPNFLVEDKKGEEYLFPLNTNKKKPITFQF